MATAVESPGIVSAKEEAAAILFARETQTPPVITAPAPEEPAPTVNKQLHPTFAKYHELTTVPTHTKAADITELRPYPKFDEATVTEDTQVLRPYIDSSEYITSPVESTTVTVQTPTPVITATEAPQTVTVVESPLDRQLEEDTQYVVKFKNSTIVAATIVATIIMLMAVLMVVNIVSLVTVSAEVSALTQESITLEQSLAEGQANLEQARAAVNANAGATHEVQYVAKAESTYVEPNSAIVNGTFFDWLCHSLSRLFN